MAATKISDLTAITTAVVTDEFAAAQSGITKKMTLAQVRGNADDVPFTSNTGGILATNTGDALRELQDEILNLDATQIAFSSSTGGIIATTVFDAILEVEDESQKRGTPVELPSYAVAGVPDATLYTGQMIYVSDETGGAVPAFSDGTNWRRVTDRVVVS